MQRFEVWVRKYAEGLVALGVAVAFGLLSITGVLGEGSANVVNAAILLTLALLAATLLRGRDTAATALRKAAPVRQAPGHDLRQQLADALRGSGSWHFKGGTGSSLRVTTLSALRHRRRRDGALQLRLELLDPTSQAVRESYARMRNAFPGARPCTDDNVRVETFATILATCWHVRWTDQVTAEIALTREVSPFHWDLAARCGVQSSVDPSAAILVFEHDQPYFDACAQELRTSFGNAARHLVLDRDTCAGLGERPTDDQVRELFMRLELSPEKSWSDRLDQILGAFNDRHGGLDAPGRGARLRRLRGRLFEFGDALVTLGIAVVFGLLTVLDVVGANGNVVSAVILLTLALLAMILLRDRSLLDKATKAASVRMLSGEKIGQQLQLARNRSREWWYKGATGGHLRTVMLPRWVQHAEQENWAEISLHLEILDPTNDAHCRQYAELRNSLPSIAGSRREEWTADRVRLESYATILAACWHRRHSSRRLKLDIALSQVVSTFRWDLSPEYVIQSREDPSASSLVFDRDQPYYQSCRRELESSFHRARTVALTRAQDHRLSDEPSLDEVRRLFVLLELPLPARFTDHDVRAIIRKALVEQNAFG